MTQIQSKVQDSITKSTEHIKKQIEDIKKKVEDSVKQIEHNITQVDNNLREYIETELGKIKEEFKDKLMERIDTFYSTLARGAPFAGQALDYGMLEIDGNIVSEINSLIGKLNEYYCDMYRSGKLAVNWQGSQSPQTYQSSTSRNTSVSGRSCEDRFKEIDLTTILSNNAISNLNEYIKDFAQHIQRVSPSNLGQERGVDSLVKDINLDYSTFDRAKGGVNLKPFYTYLDEIKSRYTDRLKEYYSEIEREFREVKGELDKLQPVKDKVEQVIGKDKLKNYLDYNREIEKIQGFITLNNQLQSLLTKVGDEIDRFQSGIEQVKTFPEEIKQNLRFLKGIKEGREDSYNYSRRFGREHSIRLVKQQLEIAKSNFKNKLKKIFETFYSNLSSAVQFITHDTVDLTSLEKINLLISDIEYVGNGKELKKLDRINEGDKKKTNFEKMNKALSKLRHLVDRTNPDNLSTPDDLDKLVSRTLNLDYDSFDRQDLMKPFEDFAKRLKTDYVSDIRGKKQNLLDKFEEFNAAIQPLEQVKQEMDRLYYFRTSNHEGYYLIDDLIKRRDDIQSLLTSVSGQIVPALETAIEDVTREFQFQTRPQLTNLMQLRELNDTLQGHISLITRLGQLVSSLKTGQKDLQQFETTFKSFNSSGYFRDVSDILSTVRNLLKHTTTPPLPRNQSLNDAKLGLSRVISQLEGLSSYPSKINSLYSLLLSLRQLDSVSEKIKELQKRDQESVMSKLEGENRKLESYEITLSSIGLTVSELKTFPQKLQNFKRMEQNFQSLLSHHKLMELKNNFLKDITSLELAKLTGDNGFDSKLQGAKDKLEEFRKAFDSIKNESTKHSTYDSDRSGLDRIKSQLEQIKTQQVYNMIQNISQIEEKGPLIKEHYTHYSQKFIEFRQQIDRLYHCIDYVVRDFIRCSLKSTISNISDIFKVIRLTPTNKPKSESGEQQTQTVRQSCDQTVRKSPRQCGEQPHSPRESQPTGLASKTVNQSQQRETTTRCGALFLQEVRLDYNSTCSSDTSRSNVLTSSLNGRTTLPTTILSRSLSRLGNNLSCYSFLLLGHYSTIDSKFTVSKLYEYSKKFDTIFFIVKRVNYCSCVRRYRPPTGSFGHRMAFYFVRPKTIIELGNKRKYEMYNHGNCLCLCLVTNYLLYPALVRSMCQLLDMELGLMSTINRNLDRFGNLETHRVSASRLSILVIEICYKLCELMRTRYLCNCKNADSNKCCCSNKDKKKCDCNSKEDGANKCCCCCVCKSTTPNTSTECVCNCFCKLKDEYKDTQYPYLISLILWISYLVENLESLHNSHVQQSLQHLCNLYEQVDNVGSLSILPKITCEECKVETHTPSEGSPNTRQLSVGTELSVSGASLLSTLKLTRSNKNGSHTTVGYTSLHSEAVLIRDNLEQSLSSFSSLPKTTMFMGGGIPGPIFTLFYQHFSYLAFSLLSDRSVGGGGAGPGGSGRASTSAGAGVSRPGVSTSGTDERPDKLAGAMRVTLKRVAIVMADRYMDTLKKLKNHKNDKSINNGVNNHNSVNNNNNHNNHINRDEVCACESEDKCENCENLVKTFIVISVVYLEYRRFQLILGMLQYREVIDLIYKYGMGSKTAKHSEKHTKNHNQVPTLLLKINLMYDTIRHISATKTHRMCELTRISGSKSGYNSSGKSGYKSGSNYVSSSGYKSGYNYGYKSSMVVVKTLILVVKKQIYKI